MDESKKKVVMVVVIVACLGLAAAIAVINFGGGGGTSNLDDLGPQPVLCVNPDCGHIFEMTVDERRQIMLERGRRMRRAGPMAFTCPQCGEESAYQANKCTKCNTVFIADYSTGDFSDRCPECGYSAIEERRQQKDQ